MVKYLYKEVLSLELAVLFKTIRAKTPHIYEIG